MCTARVCAVQILPLFYVVTFSVEDNSAGFHIFLQLGLVSPDFCQQLSIN